MTKILSVVSTKGGVGKTTLVANVAAALVTKFGRSVTIVDANLSSPALSLSYGIYSGSAVTLNDVLASKAMLPQAIYAHQSGVRIIPASLSLNKLFGINIQDISRVIRNALSFSDFVLIDASSGINNESLGAMAASDELLCVATPHMPSLVDLAKTLQVAQELGTKPCGIVMNRVRNRKYEFKKDEVADFAGAEVIGCVEEDERVLKSANGRAPVILTHPNSAVCDGYKRIAARLCGEEYIPPLHRRMMRAIGGWI